MTKKDYVKLAQALKDSKPFPPEITLSYDIIDEVEDESMLLQWNNTVIMIADTLKLDNPRFDHNRFLAACSYGE